MTRRAKSTLLFIAIGLAIYAGVYFAAEQLVYRTGKSNPFYKIETAQSETFDWIVLGASHAMPLDFADFNAVVQRETGLRVLNLASPGTGPLYNRFVLEQFLQKHSAKNLLYVLDSFGFYSPVWNEDRFADAKLLGRTPFDPAIARRLLEYSRHDGVDPRAVADYVMGFSKINNRERVQQDIWEGETQFDRVYRPSATAVRSRIAYLYPKPPAPERFTRYLAVFSGLLDIAERSGVRVTVIKMPMPAGFRAQLPEESAFDEGVLRLLSARSVPFQDFSARIEEPRYYFDTDHLNRAGLTEFLSRGLKAVLTQPSPQ